MKAITVILFVGLCISMYLGWHFYSEYSEIKSELVSLKMELEEKSDCLCWAAYSASMTKVEEPQALELTNQYMNFFDSRVEGADTYDGRYGGFISGNILYEMLANEDVNGIAYRFGIDTTDADTEKERIHLIMIPVKAELASDGKIDAFDMLGDRYYLNNNWCPPDCAIK